VGDTRADRATVLVLSQYYLPAYRAGGGLRVVARLVETLGQEFHFRIVTTDRDEGDTVPLPGVRAGEWQQVGNAQVLYLPPNGIARSILRALRTEPYDLLHINGVFEPTFDIVPLLYRRARLAPVKPTLVTPHGDLLPGALRIKSRKKRAYLAFAKATRLFAGVLWHATDELEADGIRVVFGANARIRVTPCIITTGFDSLPPRTVAKPAGRLRAVYLSKVAPKKNLHLAIGMLAQLRGEISLGIYGAKCDPPYWAVCEAAIAGLPGHVTVQHHGAVPQDEVPRILRDHDVFLMPTVGENYGYAIIESLSAGCPVVISQATPWRGLAGANAGHDIPLQDTGGFVRSLQRLTDMTEAEHGRWREGARAYARTHPIVTGAVEQSRLLLEAATAGVRRAAKLKVTAADE